MKRGNQYLHAAFLSMPMQQCAKTVSLDDDGSVEKDVAALEQIVLARMRQREKEQANAKA